LAVDPDERHAADLLVGANGVQNDVRLAVLADRWIGEHAFVVIARGAPVGEDDAARAVRGGLHAYGEERGDGVDGGSEVDGDDFAGVVARGWGDDRGAAGGGLWEGPTLEGHGRYLLGSEAETETETESETEAETESGSEEDVDLAGADGVFVVRELLAGR